MRIERLFTQNALHNFNYFVMCEETGEALVIDPWDATQCLEFAAHHRVKITQIVNTHAHGDHTRGNAELKAKTQARILAHHAASHIHPDTRLYDNDLISLGTSVHLLVIDTPGHTLSHICLFNDQDVSRPVLFTGDTLFNAGVGNCHNGGDPLALYETFETKIAPLPEITRIYPGHDYLLHNLGFSVMLEPHNAYAKRLFDAIQVNPLETHDILTLADEKRINAFLRLDSPEITWTLHKKGLVKKESPSRQEVFLALRTLRNTW